MLHRAINYFIEDFGYFLVCSVINAVKHQKVTKNACNNRSWEFEAAQNVSGIRQNTYTQH